MKKISKVMKLCPLHKQPNGLKTQCGHLLEKYFGETPNLLVLKSLGFFLPQQCLKYFIRKIYNTFIKQFVHCFNFCKKLIVVVLLLNFNSSTGNLCDELPTSLVYLDTSVSPHKLLGHVKIDKSVEENAVQLDFGKF